MRFDRLRLSGFKSFVEPTELLIRDGLTGVVGPNGCGKSNLLEALRWVMGESSPKSMRGGGMDDVIFAGTARRPARDFADVTLTIDNRSRRAAAQFNADDVLEVSRRIEREMGSAYRINGREARAKAVQLLFADAATGAHSPALVSQGRVAAIIAAKPVERRALLEEAAGISGLHVRRREAEIRLRAAEANLARLADVMAASEAQAASLRRQARAAAKYRELSEAIRAAEARLLHARWAAAQEEVRAAEAAQDAAEATLNELTRAAARLSAEQANAAAAMPGLRAVEAERAAAVQRLTTARATLLAERAAAVQRLADLDAALAAAQAETERERGRAADSAATQARLAGEREMAERAAAEAEAARGPGMAAAEAAAVASTEAERGLASAVEAHAALLAEARSARAGAEAAKGRAERVGAELARLTRERDAALASRAAQESVAAIAAAEAEVERLAGVAAEAAEAIAAAEAERRAAAGARETVERALTAARSELAGLSAELAALERLAAGAAGKVKGRVALSVAAGFEAALAASLGEDVNAEVGAGAAGEKPVRRWLGAAGEGDPALPAGVRALAAMVEAPVELARRLRQVGVVDGVPEAALLAGLLPGQRLVNREGALWRWDGFFAPPGGAQGAVAESLRQANRLAELKAAVAPAKARVAEVEAELAVQKGAESAAASAEAKGRAARAEAERGREQIAGRLAGLRAAAAQAAARVEAMSASIARLGAEGEAARAEAVAAGAALADLPDASAAAGAVAEARGRAERARAALAAARAEAAGVERSLAEARARMASLGREITEWQGRDAAAAGALEALRRRVAGLGEERARLVSEPAAMGARLGLLEQELGAAEEARGQAGDAVLAAELSLAEVDRAARAANGAVADAREARATMAARVAHAREGIQALHAQVVATFGIAPRALPEALGFARETVEVEGLAARLDGMVAERERLGAVNLLADKELGEIEAGLAVQKQESGELETAIARLRGSIGNLNREGRVRLLEAFRAVDGHFRDLFVTLFGGGAAELRLSESDDVLEAGLEIMAQPPGKKLQSLTLLSGGEQALTACALIFALFLTNPAPICVLDEVDAPLDDANVERFCNLLDHMAGLTETRFLIVTHNAVTMSRMHRLFGVTMAEAGVSQLVSVELREAERLVQRT
ncbi:chromosome segregation protein SMC [Sandaracinobacteroides saxicola]|uniref:Chromosome partition protein Smc n=1 Tax=Sandaracinobacteroides saxicola TaxID=2759707 RepID=A0A7G5ILJ9_9SPHN|nr:chromosome segregation protein SMC [Sandaracinobacteroides saxicola]QMW24241.1 chromosome segregation protein SMC [Sandaracinobacteroides saxicola]